MSIDNIRAAGQRTTKGAWLKNQLRKGVFAAARPYFVEISREIDRSVSAVSAVVMKLEEADPNLEGSISAAVIKLEEADRNLGDETEVSFRLASALKEEMQRFNGLLDGLHKDQVAYAHRLGNLEDGVDAAQKEAEALRDRIDGLHKDQVACAHRLGNLEDGVDAAQKEAEALRDRIDGLHAPAGMATLLPSHPIAVPGTSLVLSSGPYGCFLLRQPDLISDHILAGSFWDSHLKPVIERAGRFDGSAIDAGAYLGFHSVYMARFFRTVHAFEPQVEIYRMLCTNLLLNKCRNVTAVNSALYNVPGYLRLADSVRQEIPLPVTDGAVDYDRVGNAAVLTFQLTDESDLQRVCTRTIDQLDLMDLALIKVDTQGSDLHVLKGARATIQRCRPIITAEYERELAKGHGNTLEDYHHYFDEMAYDVQELDSRTDGKQVDLLATPR